MVSRPRDYPSWIPPLRPILEAQKAKTDVLTRETGRIIPYVFHRQGERILNLYSGWRSACRKAGIPGKLPHDLRRSAVRNLERAGVPRSVAMKMVGHKTEAMYRRYAIVSESDLQAGGEKLNALNLEQLGTEQKIVPIKRAK